MLFQVMEDLEGINTPQGNIARKAKFHTTNQPQF